VLLNAGKGQFNWQQPNQSGLSLKGAIKDIQELRLTPKGSRGLLITQNNERPVLFKVKN
jgi:hypothetical protein